MYADGQLGTEEACLFVSDELRQEPTRHGNYGSQYICEGNFLLACTFSSWLSECLQFFSFYDFKDCEDPNPLIRALAVRTMGCIRVDKITEYLCEPLRKCLKDEDPYVRKTAAVCVAKLYDINAHLVEDQGFLDQLKDLLSDSNPMVSS